MDSIRYQTYRVLAECTYCGAPCPLNGPMDRVPCPTCHQENSIPQGLWSALFHEVYMRTIDTTSEHEQSLVKTQGSLSLKVHFRGGNPRCSSCQHPLTLPHDMEQVEVVHCDSCGADHPVRAAPAWVPRHQGMRLIGTAVREHHNHSETPFQTTSITPIAMNCPSCSGSLNLSQHSKRLTTCAYCGGEFYIPDPIWNRLHPQTIASNWIACVNIQAPKGGNSGRQRRRTNEEKRYRRAYAKYQKNYESLQNKLNALKQRRRGEVKKGYFTATLVGFFLFGMLTFLVPPITKTYGRLFCDGEIVAVTTSSGGHNSSSQTLVCREKGKEKNLTVQLMLFSALLGVLFSNSLWSLWLLLFSQKYKARRDRILEEINALQPPSRSPQTNA